MTMPKPSRSPAEMEDIILWNIFLVSLVDSMENDSRVVYLEMSAAEILSEGNDLKLSRDLMERIIIDRLSGSFPSAEPPFQYLLNSYRRAYEEGKKIASMKDKSVTSKMEIVVKQAKRLVVLYYRIHLGNHDMFPNHVTIKSKDFPSQPLLFSEVGGSIDGFGGISSSGGVSPPGFVEDCFRDADYDSIESVLKQLFEDLRGSVMKISVLGNFQQPLKTLLLLVNYPVGAKALVNHSWWIPKSMYFNGRMIEMTSILGSFFHVSALADHAVFKSDPEIG